MPGDFERANKLLSKLYETSTDTVENDYYLFSFDNNELFEIIHEKDKWNELDYHLAKKILKERGIEVTEKEELELADKRIEKLKYKEKGSVIVTIVGYCIALIGGILGIGIGLYFWKAKRTLPTGERVYIFNASTRVHGFVIFFLGILIISIFLFTIKFFE